MLLNQNYLSVVGCIQSITTTLQRDVKPHILLFQVSLKLNKKKRKDYLLILLCIMVKECYLIAFRLSSELKQIVLKRLKFTLFQVKLKTLKNYSETDQELSDQKCKKYLQFFLNSFFFLWKIDKDFSKAKERELFFLYP